VNLNLLLAEIMMGKSPIKNFFFKHFTILDHFESEFYYQIEVEQAQNCGLKSEKKLLEEARQKKLWTEDDESTLTSLEFSISGLTKALNKNENEIIKNAMKDRIASEEDAIKRILNKKEEIIKISAEKYAERKRSDRVLKNNLFADKNLIDKIEEDDLTQEIISLVFAKINEFNNRETCAKVAYNTSFFDLFSIHEKEPFRIFNKGGQNLTFAQKNVISVSKILMNKLKNLDIPKNKLEDPIAILYFDDKEGNKSQDNVVKSGREAQEILKKEN
jgi:hypothetical protein